MFKRNIKLLLHNIQINIRHFRRRWIEPVISIHLLRNTLSAFKRYLSDWLKYSKLPGSEKLLFLNSYPCLFDRVPTAPFDSHYFYQAIWAFKLIRDSHSKIHIDIGSQVAFVGMLSTITNVIFIDIRPLLVRLENFYSISGSILSLPFADNSIHSISCLHVAEHIGLGRYGDPLDPEGTKKAIHELARILAPGGKLYFSLPVGKPRVCFNAHRIHTPQQIIDCFQELDLREFSGIDENGVFRQNIKPAELQDVDYSWGACGLFCFTKL